MAQTGQLIDPYRNFNFLVELDGIAQASFTECSGLGSTTEIIETREGGDNTTVHKLPGKTAVKNITLKWGLTNSTELWDWRQQIVDGNPVRKNISVILRSLDQSTEVARWNVIRAWPSEWDGPAFNAKGNDIAIDTLVLACEGVTRV